MTQATQHEDAGLLNEKTRAEIEHWKQKFPDEQSRSALIAALTAAQHQNGGWLSRDMMDAVADYMGLPKIAVYEVASFYSMFELEPVGRNIVAICTNISCQLCGADDIVAHVEGKLSVKLGGTTGDGRITLKNEEECLAACKGAPMMTVNGHYYEDLTPEKVDEILDGLE